MSVLKRRSRIVSFRLSADEYEAMREHCLSEGARSISDYARTMACHLRGNGDGHRSDLETTIHALRRRVEELDREVRRLVQFMDEMPAPVTGDGDGPLIRHTASAGLARRKDAP